MLELVDKQAWGACARNSMWVRVPLSAPERKVLNMDKQDFKKSKEELQDYLSFRRRGSKVAPKKGKGSFKRKQKHKEDSRD